MKRKHASSDEAEENTTKRIKKEDLAANSNALQIAPGDQVFLFECPENFDLSTLGRSIGVDGKIVITNDDTNEKYGIEFSEETIQAHFIVPSHDGHKLSFAPCVTRINLAKQVDIPKEVIRGEEESLPLMPRELRLRHPLLGADFESHMKEVSKRLKKSKKKHKTVKAN